MGFVLLLVAGVLLFRWRIYRMRKEMEERFGEGFGGAAGGFDVDAVVGAAFADGAEFGHDGAPYRPREFALAVFGDRV